MPARHREGGGGLIQWGLEQVGEEIPMAKEVPVAEEEGPRTAIVTGGSRGIGLAVVTALAEAGWRVCFCARTQASIEQAAAELSRFGAAVAGKPVDVRRQAEVDAWVGEVLGQAERIDCLVNNAGLGIFGPVDTLSGEQWREVVDTNLSAAFYAIRAVAPAMKARGAGWIFNIGSLAGKHGFAGGAAYNASKFGLLGLSEAAMLDLRPHGIRVASILPGSVDTGFGHPPGPQAPGGRAGRGADRSWMLAPDDVAAMLMHLLTYPPRALPSLVEMRPSQPPAK
jgi:3-oxoacyl-[acyl-carrier protein] reductase